MCVLAMVAELALRGDKCASVVCINRWLGGVCVIPSLIYFWQTVRHYDVSLQERKRNKDVEVAELIAENNKMAQLYEDNMKEISGHAVGFAGDTFNKHVRDFKKFLLHIKNHPEKY